MAQDDGVYSARTARGGQTRIHDPGALRQAGTNAVEAAGRMRGAGELPTEESSAAARQLKGGNWGGALGGALDATVRTWSSQTAALVSTCNGIGDKCRATADNYTTAEAENTSRFSAVPRDPTPFG